jgi:hypothetical protein
MIDAETLRVVMFESKTMVIDENTALEWKLAGCDGHLDSGHRRSVLEILALGTC